MFDFPIVEFACDLLEWNNTRVIQVMTQLPAELGYARFLRNAQLQVSKRVTRTVDPKRFDEVFAIRKSYLTNRFWI